MKPDYFSRRGPICPYCEHVHEPDSTAFYDDRNYTSDTCTACKKPFFVSVVYEATWTTAKFGTTITTPPLDLDEPWSEETPK